MGVRVVVEVTPRRAFASALDWPGWSRRGKTAEEALDALLAYAPRYAPVAKRAKVAFAPPKTLRGLEVVETLPDGVEGRPRRAEGVKLATGPRGGGRDLDRILDHVREAERSYTAQLGGRAPASADRPSSRPGQDAFIDAVHARNRGELPDRGPRGGARWSPRYAVRRAAWHVLDHAWEIEDRSS